MSFDYTNLLEDATTANNGDFIFTNRAGTVDTAVATANTAGEWCEEVSSTTSSGTGPETPNNTAPPGAATGFVYTESSSPAASTTWACRRAVSFDSSIQNIFLDLIYMVAVDVTSEFYIEYATVASPNETTDWTILETIVGTGAATAWISDTFDFTAVGGSGTFWIRVRFNSANAFTNDFCISTWREYSVDTSGISSVTPAEFDMDTASVTIAGTAFGATIGASDVYLSPNDLLSEAGEVDITSAVNTWSDTSINLDLTSLSAAELASLHTMGPGARFLIVNVGGTPGTTEYFKAVTLHRPQAFEMVLGAATPGTTTARLTGMTGTFAGGRIEETAAQNPSTTTTDVASNGNREDVWSIQAKTLARAVQYDFRVLYDGVVADTITQVPKWTVTSGAAEVIAGAVTISASVAAAMEQGRVIAGAVPIAATPAAAMIEGHQIAGAQQIDLTAAAAFAEGRDLVAGVTIDLTAAAVMAYVSGTEIAGAVTISALPAAVMLQGEVIVGASSITMAPAAALALGHEIAGASSIDLTAAAAFAEGRDLIAAATITLTPAAAMAEGRVIAGAVAMALTPAAALIEGRVIAGAVPIDVQPAAALQFGDDAITGNVPISALPAAAMIEGRTLAGAQTIDFGIAAILATGHQIAGAAQIDLAPAAALAFGTGQAITGALTVAMAPVADLVEGRAIDGAQRIDLLPLGALEVGRAIAGDVPITLSAAAAFDVTGVFAPGATLLADLAAAATIADIGYSTQMENLP